MRLRAQLDGVNGHLTLKIFCLGVPPETISKMSSNRAIKNMDDPYKDKFVNPTLSSWKF